MSPTVLIAVDGSDMAKKAALKAIEWFGTEAVYHAVYVYTPQETIRIPAIMDEDPGAGGYSQEGGLYLSIEERERDFVCGQLKSLMERCDVNIEIHWRRGDPRHEIVQIAEDLGVDVVVVGSRGHGSVSRLLLGSVSSFVVEHAGVSTLVVR